MNGGACRPPRPAPCSTLVAAEPAFPINEKAIDRR